MFNVGVMWQRCQRRVAYAFNRSQQCRDRERPVSRQWRSLYLSQRIYSAVAASAAAWLQAYGMRMRQRINVAFSVALWRSNSAVAAGEEVPRRAISHQTSVLAGAWRKGAAEHGSMS